MLKLRTQPRSWSERLDIVIPDPRKPRRSRSPRGERQGYRDRSLGPRIPPRRHSSGRSSSALRSLSSSRTPTPSASKDITMAQPSQPRAPEISDRSYLSSSVFTGNPSGSQSTGTSTQAQVNSVVLCLYDQLLVLLDFFDRHPDAQRGENLILPNLRIALQDWRAWQTAQASSTPAQNSSEDDFEGSEVEEGEVKEKK